MSAPVAFHGLYAIRLTRAPDDAVTATQIGESGGRPVPFLLTAQDAQTLVQAWNQLSDNMASIPMPLGGARQSYRLIRLDRETALLQPQNAGAPASSPDAEFLRLTRDWFWMADSTGRITDVIAPSGSLPAWASQLVGHRWSDIADPASRDGSTLQHAIGAERPFADITLRLRPTAAFPEVWLRLASTPFRDADGNLVGWRGSARDLSDLVTLRQTLKAARKLDRLYRTALQASPVNLTIVDARHPDMPLILVNESFCQTTGYTEAEVLGRNCRFLQGPGTSMETVNAMRAAIRKGQPFRCEILNYRRSGEPFWNALDLAPVVGNDGDIDAYVGVQVDVTAERAKRDAFQQQQRLQALGRLAGGVAHEINNLLQPALTLPQLVAESLPQSAAEERDYLDIIVEHARQARAVVADILAFSRQRAAADKDMPIGPATVAALDFVRGVLPPTIGIQKLGFEDPALGRVVRCSDTGLRQILANLAVNAAHAMGERGTLTVTASATDSHAIFTVSDTGMGMPPEVAAQIFDPFFTTKKAGEGVGLGLATVFGIVDRWGGTITVESTPDVGTAFTLSLPFTSLRPGPSFTKTETKLQLEDA